MENLVNRTGPDNLKYLLPPLAILESGLWIETENPPEPCFRFELTHSYTCDTWVAFSYVVGGLGGCSSSSFISLPFGLTPVEHTASVMIILIRSDLGTFVLCLCLEIWIWSGSLGYRCGCSLHCFVWVAVYTLAFGDITGLLQNLPVLIPTICYSHQ